MDVGDFPTRLRLSARNDADGWTGSLRTNDGTGLDLADVRSVYYHRPTRFRFPDGVSDGDSVFAAAEARLGLGGVLASLDALWVNDPAKVAVAEYKPLQLRTAAGCGLTVPRTLVTNDHSAITAFAADIGGPVVCKTFSSVMLSDVDGLRMTFTTPVEPDAIDPAQVAVTAHLVQEQITKDFEVRVTMVGSQAFAIAIHADSDNGRVDWRSDYTALRYERVDVPAQVAEGMSEYLQTFGLVSGAFDFAVTPDQEWIMFECNPAGQWLWLEHETAAPIAAAFADALTQE